MSAIAVYIIGYLLSYFMLRMTMFDEPKYTFTKEDRVVCLICSVGSWITIVVAMALVLITPNIKNADKPVKW